MVMALLYNAAGPAEAMRSPAAAAPPLPAAFRWIDQPWGLGLQCVPLALAGIGIHGWTTRELAILAAPADCESQWHQLAASGGVPRGSLTAVHQVHGAAVIDPQGRPADERPRADGLVSRDPSLMLTVRVADCAALLIADSRLGAVAAVHAGWRGTAAGIAVAAVARLRELFGSRPEDLVAALGPSIGPCCYTVGAELIGAFREGGHGESEIGRWFRQRPCLQLDLWTANREQLEAAGVPAPAIHVSGLCTGCHPDWFYSYRREGAAAGRLVGFIRASGA
jgi:polyphenol oxidase